MKIYDKDYISEIVFQLYEMLHAVIGCHNPYKDNNGVHINNNHIPNKTIMSIYCDYCELLILKHQAYMITDSIKQMYNKCCYILDRHRFDFTLNKNL